VKDALIERDYNKKDRLFWPPSSVLPADENDIVVQEGNIANHAHDLLHQYHSQVQAVCGVPCSA
jgi:hypothetical protein